MCLLLPLSPLYYLSQLDNVGLMPYRRQIVAVSESLFFSKLIEAFRLTLYVSVGKPIHVERCEKPTLEELTRVQQQYIEELTRFVSILPFSLRETDESGVESGTHIKTRSQRRG